MDREYRAAIALNNVGVSLLEQHCYAQAFQTLKDAARIIRVITRACAVEAAVRDQPRNLNRAIDCSILTIPAADEMSPQSQPLEIVLHRAAQRMAQPNRSTLAHFPPFSVFIVSDDNGELTQRSMSNATFNTISANVSGTSLSQIIAIRIVTYENMEDQAGILSDQECNIKCAIIFHNMGIALLCMVLTKSGSGSCCHVVHASQHSKLLELSCALLHIHINDNLRADYQTSNSSGLAEPNQLCILGYIFLRSLVQCLRAAVVGMENSDKRSKVIATAASYEIRLQQLEERMLCQARIHERTVLAKLQQSKSAAAA